MIDTDKYEGHTQDWKLGHSGVSPFVHIGELTVHATNDYLQEIDMGEANARLIADAPLLLQAYNEKCEEVKRLREEISRLNKWEDNVREFFGDEAMIDLYDIYGVEGDD